MNPNKVDRNHLRELTDLPNVGKALAGDLRLIGVNTAADLVGRDPFAMYDSLCKNSNARHDPYDPCVIDVFISITRFMDGGPPQPWWNYTDERKKTLWDSTGKLQ